MDRLAPVEGKVCRDELQQRINAIADVSLLKKTQDKAWDCKSLEDLEL